MKPAHFKKVFLLAALGLGFWACKQPKGNTPPLLPNYNNNFYPTVLQAAQGIGLPFFLQEQLDSIPGIAVSADTNLVSKGYTYPVYNNYENPKPGMTYFIDSSQYQAFGISDSVKALWPKKLPYALYDPATAKFNSTVDCVGYGTRVLAATGSGVADTAHNAYLALGTVARRAGAPFAAPGIVAEAYQIAIAFPLLPSAGKLGWQYVSGNVIPKLIDSVNNDKVVTAKFKPYHGVAKSGFASALPGDILSFGYDGGGSNGHFMVFAKAPQKLDSAQFSAYFAPSFHPLADGLSLKYTIYAVTVYDCSGKNVHFNDSRKYMSGIGHGTLFILTNLTTDIPQGFIFQPPVIPKPKVNAADTTTFSIGAKIMGAPGVATVAISVGRYTAPQ